jgi:RNA polymerase sigma factor (sigma-70 family)
MELEPTVFIVDDDEAVRRALEELVASVGLAAETYASALEFLEGCDPTRPGCLLLDVRMPGMSGLQLQEELSKRQITLPVIIITGHGDIPTAVHAMRSGALSILEKPFRDQELLDEVQNAIEQSQQASRERKEQRATLACLATLTERERAVLDLVVAGETSKEIAHVLGISHKTIEFHRAKISEKLGVNNAVKLTRLILGLPAAAHHL